MLALFLVHTTDGTARSYMYSQVNVRGVTMGVKTEVLTLKFREMVIDILLNKKPKRQLTLFWSSVILHLTSVAVFTPLVRSHSRMQWSQPAVITPSSWLLGHTTAVTGWLWPERVTRGVLVVGLCLGAGGLLFLDGRSPSSSTSSVALESAAVENEPQA